MTKNTLDGDLDPTLTPSRETTSPSDSVLAPTHTPVRVKVDLNTSSPDPAALPLLSPDRYVLGPVLGEGGQAVVNLATDGTIGREVALKLLRDPSQSPHFIREARVTGQLEHPGIVPIYELGRTPSGDLVCAQRRVRGKTLQDALRDAPDLKARLELLPHFVDVCQAVAYAHSRGVLHRDLKPSNLMTGEFGQTVVLDWGLAKVLGEADAPSARPISTSPGETVAGAVIGTPLYMSPEQAEGRECTKASDVWSLGVILYELLAGRRPFEATSVDEALTRVKAGVFPPLTEACPDVAPELAAVVARALQKDPSLRFPDAGALANEVAAYRAGGRVSVYQYSSMELLRRFVRRNKVLSLVVVLAVLLTEILCVFLWLGLNVSKKNYLNSLTEQARAAERRGSWNEAYDYLQKAMRNVGTASTELHQRLVGEMWLGGVFLEGTEAPERGAFDDQGRAYLLMGGRDPSLVVRTPEREVSRVSLAAALPNGLGTASFAETSRSAALIDRWDSAAKSLLPRLSVSADGSVVTIATGQELVVVRESTGPAPHVERLEMPAEAVDTSADGKWVLVRLGPDLRKCAVIATKEKPSADERWDLACAANVALSRDGQTVYELLGEKEPMVRSYAWGTGPKPEELEEASGRGISALHLSSDGSILAAPTGAATLEKFSAATGRLEVVRMLDEPLFALSDCAGGALLMGESDSGIYFFEGNGLAQVGFLDQPAHLGVPPRFLAERCRVVAMASRDRFEINADKLLATTPLQTSWSTPPGGLGPEVKGKGVLARSADGALSLFEIKGRAVRTVWSHQRESPVSAVAASEDGSRVAVRHADRVTLLDAATGKMLGEKLLPDGHAVAFNAGADTVIAPVGNKLQVLTFHAAEGTFSSEPVAWDSIEDDIDLLVVPPGGRFVVFTTPANQSVHVWRRSPDTIINTSYHVDFRWLSPSADGRFVAIGMASAHDPEIVDLENIDHFREYNRHLTDVMTRGAAFSPCANALALSGLDGRLHFAATARGPLGPDDKDELEVLPFEAPFRDVRNLLWTSDGLVFDDHTGRLYKWPLQICDEQQSNAK